MKNASRVILVLSVCTSYASATTTYTFTELGTLGGPRSYAYGIDNAGHVVGVAETTEPGGEWAHAAHAFCYDQSGMHDLGTLGRTHSEAYGINNAGRVVGVYYDGPGDRRAFATNPMHDLGAFGTGRARAFGINDNGLIVGDSDTLDGSLRAASYSGDGAMSDLGTLGGTHSTALGVNASGQIVGASAFLPGQASPFHAYRTQPGGDVTTGVDLGTLGGPESWAYGINDAGAVAGYSLMPWDNSLGVSARHAFCWTSAGGMIDLGTLGGDDSEGLAIGADDEVVGWANVPGNARHAFLRVSGAMHDLNSLADLPSGWTLNRANATNRLGQIVGYGTDPAGNERAFLLTPVPEPLTLCLMGVGALAVLRRYSVSHGAPVSSP